MRHAQIHTVLSEKHLCFETEKKSREKEKPISFSLQVTVIMYVRILRIFV